MATRQDRDLVGNYSKGFAGYGDGDPVPRALSILEIRPRTSVEGPYFRP